MEMIYHSTSWRDAPRIAKRGAVLSPYQLRLEFLQENCAKNQGFKQRVEAMGGAEKVAQNGIGYELRESLKKYTLPVTNDLKIAQNRARSMDIVLGVLFSPEEIKDFFNINDEKLFVHGKISLANLREVYLGSDSIEHIKMIRDSFKSYEGIDFKKF